MGGAGLSVTYRVALTGGIGSGKSTVAEGFARHGVMISDADAISHALTGPEGEALPAVRAAFGPRVFDRHGRGLDRAALRALVFSDPAARRRLQQILHPMILERMLEETASVSSPYALLVIPLLLETGQDRLVDRVLVIDLPESEQVARVARRSGLDAPEIRRIIASQATRDQRLAAADDVIDNSGDPGLLDARVAHLHRRYVEFAHGHRAQG
jgi:dephospho-CoA kinase